MRRFTPADLIVALASLAPIATLGGCDPIITVAGAMFPAWLLCALVGITAASVFRPLFIGLGLEQFIRPAILVYPSLAVIVGTITWLIFFSRL
jgi:hypothetical protein